MRLRETLWEQMEPGYRTILRHPFVTGLADGSLPLEAFRHYVLQDAVYLRDYARALALVAARADDPGSVAQFATDAAEAITVERSLHAGFVDGFGMTAAQAEAVPAGPTTLAYTCYLLRVAALGSYAEALAVVLPCYWIYAEVGAALAGAGSPDPLYQRWIATYGGQAFQTTVELVLDEVDRVGARCSQAEVDRMIEHVVQTTRYEWMFFDAGWRQETWPVG